MPKTKRRAGRPPRISQATIDHVRRLAVFGLSHAQIARALGITPQYCGQLIRGQYRPPANG